MFRLLSCGRDVGLFGFVREEKRPVMPGRFAVVVRAKVMTAFAAYYFSILAQCSFRASFTRSWIVSTIRQIPSATLRGVPSISKAK